MLELDTFKTVIAATPLVSIDLIVRNYNQEVLLGRRTNKPAQGCWFVPGGRILKDETLEAGYKRLLKAELNLEWQPSKFRGVYQHFYAENVVGGDFTTHYVVMAYEISVGGNLVGLPTEQHDDYSWLSESELQRTVNVHEHTKWYFQEGLSADASFTCNKNERV